MENGFKRLDCNDNDVLALGNDTFKIERFKNAVNTSFNSSVGRKFVEQLASQSIHLNMQKLHPKSSDEAWFNEGIDCEFLNLGSKAWKKGKVKINISVEFYVEEEEDSQITEPESPLDDIRRMAN